MQWGVGLGEVQSLLGFGAVAGGTALYPPVQRKAGKVKGGADQGTGVDVERSFEGQGGKSVESISLVLGQLEDRQGLDFRLI